MSERKPHKWSEVIKAWADGKPIQVRMDSVWVDYALNNMPPFDFTCYEFRVKPENIVVSVMAYLNMDDFIQLNFQDEPNLRLEFSPDTYQLIKAEVIG